MSVDNKQFSTNVVCLVSLGYTVLLFLRYLVKKPARCAEMVVVYIFLLVLLIVLPVVFGAV